jgi:putative peptidoglycan lipid II flippase
MSTDSSESSAADAGPSRDLSKQGGVVAGMTLASRISGFVRDVVLSNFFGATGVADAFFVAFRIPNFFRRLFAEGAFSQAFVPVASGYVERGDRAALVRFVKVMGGDFALLLTIICVLGVFAADWLIALFAPGFWNDDGRLALAGDMLRVTFPYLGFISLTAFAAGLLNSHHHYAVPAFTPVLLNLCLIAAALWGTPLFAEPVMALAWGVLVAGVVQWLFQLPALARIELLVTPVINWQHEGVRRVGKLMLPAVFAASVSQINALVGTILASLLVTGSISWLYYSDRLLELPIGLVAIAIGTVLLPNLSRLHAAGSTEQFSRSLEWGMRMGALFGAPAAAALYLLALPLITTIFFHGAMTALDVKMSALALEGFSLGLLGFVAVKIVAPAYFSRQDTTTPFHIAVVAVVVNLVLAVAVFWWFGHVGLAFATSVSALVQAYLLIRGVVRDGSYQPTRELGGFLARVALGCVLMGGALWWLVPPADTWLEMSKSTQVVQLALACVGGGGLYGVVLLLCGVRPADLRHRVGS